MNIKSGFSSLFNHKCFTFLVAFSLLLSLSYAPVFAAPALAGRAAPATLAAGSWKCDPSGGPACWNSLFSVAMVSANEGWAIGGIGNILHYTTTVLSSIFIPLVRK